MKNKTTYVNVSLCLYCALLIEYHTRRVLSLHNFYTIYGQIDTATQWVKKRRKTKSAMSGYLIPGLIEKLSKWEIFEYDQFIYQVSPALVRKFSCGDKTGLARETFQQRSWEILNIFITKNMNKILPILPKL